MYFEITGTNVRLLGTIHRVPADMPALPAWVLGAYRWSDSVYLEHATEPLRQLMSRTDGRSLRSEIQPQLWDALTAQWATFSSTQSLEKLKAWAALLVLASQLEPAAAGVESTFLRWARRDDPRPIEYLESATAAVSQFEAVAHADIERCLKLALFEADRARRANREIYQLWVAQDLLRLTGLAQTLPFTSIPTVRRLLIEQRNAAWVPVIDSLSERSEKTLICVGALHLCGANNLIDLLDRRIRQVKTG
jgi:uncharacterized protein YbaP (TraB family)